MEELKETPPLKTFTVTLDENEMNAIAHYVKAQLKFSAKVKFEAGKGEGSDEAAKENTEYHTGFMAILEGIEEKMNSFGFPEKPTGS